RQGSRPDERERDDRRPGDDVLEVRRARLSGGGPPDRAPGRARHSPAPRPPPPPPPPPTRRSPRVIAPTPSTAPSDPTTSGAAIVRTVSGGRASQRAIVPSAMPAQPSQRAVGTAARANGPRGASAPTLIGRPLRLAPAVAALPATRRE